MPTDVPGSPSPTLLVPRQGSIEVLYKTSEGVLSAEELFKVPGRLIDIGTVWPTFSEATLTLGLED